MSASTGGNAEHAQREGDTGQPDPARPGSSQAEKPDLNALRDAIVPLVNQAITTHTRRLEARFDERLASLGQPKPETPAAKPEGDQQPTGYKAQLEAMQRRLDAVEKERETERKAAAEIRRDADLRRTIEEVGVFNVEAVFRHVKHDLKTGADGNYYATGKEGELLSSGEFVKAAVAANPWMQPATGRGGGGGTGQPAGAGPPTKVMAKDHYLQELDKYAEAGDDAGMYAFQSRVLAGEIAVQGVNTK